MMTKGKLTEELDEIFDEQLFAVLVSRNIFRQLKPILARKREAEAFWMFVVRSYESLACTAVRRAVDRNRQSRSLLRFLNKLKDPSCLALLSRVEYLRSQGTAMKRTATKKYDALTGGAPNLTARIIERDVQAIQNAAEPIKNFVDTTIAHTDQKKLDATMPQLDAAIDVITDVYDRYATVLDASPVVVDGEYETDVASVIEKLNR